MPKELMPALLFILLALPLNGCSVTHAPGESAPRDVLTRDQLDNVDFLSAYDAIRRLKPIWLRSERGQDSFITQGRRGLRVYVDGLLFGDKESLKTIQVQDIEEIRFLDKREATMEFGTDHGEGALLIRTRR
jgi:hypothetical protein